MAAPNTAGTTVGEVAVAEETIEGAATEKAATELRGNRRGRSDNKRGRRDTG